MATTSIGKSTMKRVCDEDFACFVHECYDKSVLSNFSMAESQEEDRSRFRIREVLESIPATEHSDGSFVMAFLSDIDK